MMKAIFGCPFFTALLAVQTASAWYDPSLGRWLTRDPIGEPGFQSIQKTGAGANLTEAAVRQSQWIHRTTVATAHSAEAAQRKWIFRDPPRRANLYLFLENTPANSTDPTGLQTRHPPTTPTWNTPPGSACNAYDGCGAKGCILKSVCNNAGSGCWANCVRGCLLADWNSSSCGYSSGLALRHLNCWSQCDAECNGWTEMPPDMPWPPNETW
jgi:hypothetical protein